MTTGQRAAIGQGGKAAGTAGQVASGKGAACNLANGCNELHLRSATAASFSSWLLPLKKRHDSNGDGDATPTRWQVALLQVAQSRNCNLLSS